MSDTPHDDAAMEQFIGERFEENYEALRLESGASLAPEVKETALKQVLLYWRVLRRVAEAITDTEVHLSLPLQETPNGRDYTMEGVVDIVRDNDRTIMYDIKTHDADYVRANRTLYEEQLNVYAHIWQTLRGQPLDEAAIIATDYPRAVADALEQDDTDAITEAVAAWQPLVPINFDAKKTKATIREFGKVVDAIEAGHFAPRPTEDLWQTFEGASERFATRVCRNCDARFSCASYREYLRGVQDGRTRRTESAFLRYLDDLGEEVRESWRTTNLDAAEDADDLRQDFPEFPSLE